jgi:Fuc2NAc and GlcNAc transferase
MDMTLELLLPILAGIVAWGITAWVYRRAERLHLMEYPNFRSSHEYPTPSGGGIAIVLASVGTGLWLCRDCAAEYWVVLGLSGLIAAVGLWDDLRHLSKGLRFGVQTLASAGLVTLCAALPEDAGLSIGIALFMVLAGVWWINLFNFMDGIDGIAGSQAIFMLGTATLAGIWFHPNIAASPTWLWMMIIAAAAFGFLWHNWAPARIFMGDIGSTYLAFMILALAALSIREGWLSYAFWLILGALFIADTTITLLRRMTSGQRWLEAHRSHAYQRLARRWNSHARTTGLSIAINQLWLAPIAWLSLGRPDWGPILVTIAYAPLIVGVIALDAGKPDQ